MQINLYFSLASPCSSLSINELMPLEVDVQVTML